MKILSIASARPNFVKLAAVHHAIAESKADIVHSIMHTGQHYDPLLSDIFFKQLAIPQPKENLGIKGQDRMEVIERTKDALLPVLKQEQPDIVLVYGDVNGAVGGAQAAKELGIRIGHVEAGLRSFDNSMPEELNRIEIDQLADLLFCTEQSGVDHLQEEEVHGQIHFVGNTMIDTLIRMEPLIDERAVSTFVDRRGKETDHFAVLTLHRPSNVDDPETLASVFAFIRELSERVFLVIPQHPRLKNALDQQPAIRMYLEDRVSWGKPVDYLGFIALMHKASFILTDSGGIQEEAVLLKKRCFTLRKNTERPVTIACGSNVLIDLEKEEDRQAVLTYAAQPVPPTVTTPKFWDGKAGERIVEILRREIVD